jgi:hypothetical protein
MLGEIGQGLSLAGRPPLAPTESLLSSTRQWDHCLGRRCAASNTDRQ